MKTIILFLLFASRPCHAEEDFDAYLTRTVNRTDDAFQQAVQADATTPRIEYKQFFLGVAPSVTFGLTDILDLQVTPEITFVWEKTDRD